MCAQLDQRCDCMWTACHLVSGTYIANSGWSSQWLKVVDRVFLSFTSCLWLWYYSRKKTYKTKIVASGSAENMDLFDAKKGSLPVAIESTNPPRVSSFSTHQLPSRTTSELVSDMMISRSVFCSNRGCSMHLLPTTAKHRMWPSQANQFQQTFEVH